MFSVLVKSHTPIVVLDSFLIFVPHHGDPLLFLRLCLRLMMLKDLFFNVFNEFIMYQPGQRPLLRYVKFQSHQLSLMFHVRSHRHRLLLLIDPFLNLLLKLLFHLFIASLPECLPYLFVRLIFVIQVVIVDELFGLLVFLRFLSHCVLHKGFQQMVPAVEGKRRFTSLIIVIQGISV